MSKEQEKQDSDNKAMCVLQLVTVPKKNASISISFLPTSCLLRRNLLFLL